MEKSLTEYIDAYKIQLEKGDIKYAYRGLMKFMIHLKNHLHKECPEYSVSSTIHYGHMDNTYFSLTHNSLKQNKLKIIIMFNHETFLFEIWLVAQNKKIQKQYWELFKNSDWNTYHIPATIDQRFSIVESILIQDPDFSDFTILREQIESKTAQFIRDISVVFT